MSIDYTRSGRLAVNVLFELKKNNFDSEVTFQFINNVISPEIAVSKRSIELFEDYKDWLPNHFKSHNCDLSKLEKLDITLSIDFENATTPETMSNCTEFSITAKTIWKAKTKPEELIKIEQKELVKSTLLIQGIQENI